MSRLHITAAAALALATAACSDAAQRTVGAPDANTPQGVSFNRATEEVVPGEILVKFKPGYSATKVSGALGLRLNRMGYEAAFSVLETADGNERAAAQALAADPRVEWAE